jgi:hypothetical protein
MRIPSLEALATSPMSPEDAAKSTSMSLNMFLQPFHEQGWNPRQFGAYKLEEHTVQWLKGLETLPTSDP